MTKRGERPSRGEHGLEARATLPPIALDEVGLAQWNLLVGLRPWRPSQLLELAAYCAAYSRWAAAEAWLAEEGHGAVITIRDDKGNIKSHGVAPQVTIVERASKEMGRIAAKLKI